MACSSSYFFDVIWKLRQEKEEFHGGLGKGVVMKVVKGIYNEAKVFTDIV